MRFVPGEGPVPCDLMFIGEGPGFEEDKYGRPFVGKSGKELNRYIWHSIQRARDSVYITNLVKYRVPDDSDPTDDDIDRDAGILADELERVNPSVIVCLGRWSTRRFIGDADMDWCHGVPHMVGDWVVMPIIHPAAGLHNTEFQGKIAWDFEQLARLLKGEIEPDATVDTEMSPDYREVTHFRTQPDRRMAIDTEGSVTRPWCLSYSSIPGSAYIWRPPSPGAAPFLRTPRISKRVILHNSLHDLGVLRAMGVVLEDGAYDDTMIKAYELGIEPQGLKSLARRHCGMIMREYEEVIGNAQRNHNQLWLSKVLNSVLAESATTTPKRARARSISASAGKRSARTSRSKRRR